jgi:threonine/homoserine/homoserine lactone efflux protein
MTTYGLLAFSAMAVFLILVPSPLFRLTARFVLQRGRSAALATIPGLAVGMTVTAAVATIPVLLLSRYSPQTLAVIAFTGPWYLLAYVVFSYLDPSRRRPMADNDNLPERRTLRIFAHVVKEAVLSPRYTLAFVAVLIQVWDAAMAPLTQCLTVALACATFMGGAAAVQSLLPRRLLNRKKPAARGKAASRKAQTVFIARRAVTAGYRRIAA